MSFMKQMIAALMGAKPKTAIANTPLEKENLSEDFCAPMVASLQSGTPEQDTSPALEKGNKLRGPRITFY